MDNDKRDLDRTLEIIEGINREIVESDKTGLQDKDNLANNKDKNSRKNSILKYIAIAVISSLIGGIISPFIVLKYMDMNQEEVEINNPNGTINIESILEKSEGGSNVALVAESAMESVVGITTVRIQQYGFFQQEVDGVGSGVIVDSNGYILTNAHVIDNGKAGNIKVLLNNGDEKEAKVLWYDSLLDLAMIKVEASGLPAAKLGDSDNLVIGETVVAIGNPLGLEFQSTVTSGIISGLHRSINVDGNVIEDLIQTDASINPGNSGGPLLNARGEVIGINTAKITSGEGLGFAIPINLVKPVIEQIIKTGNFRSVYIGIVGTEVELYERQLGVDLPADKGVIIINVESNSPADKAGLTNGDIIIKIDDKEIQTMSQLKKSLFNYGKGDKAKLSILRNGSERTIEIEFTQVK
ncbi:MAG: PDZ domain-containing protein [Tissierellia bacterium]|nr:PDZ domain-containing protein [Tissierellia bacterium]